MFTLGVFMFFVVACLQVIYLSSIIESVNKVHRTIGYTEPTTKIRVLARVCAIMSGVMFLSVLAIIYGTTQ